MYHRTSETPIETITENPITTDLTVAVMIFPTDPSAVTTATDTTGNSETTVLTIADLAQVETTEILIDETQAVLPGAIGRPVWEAI